MSGYIKKATCDCDHKVKKSNCTKESVTNPKKIMFECGESVEASNFLIDSFNTETFILARVFVDTSCLCKPQVKIEFSTTVSFVAQSNVNPVSVNLTFALKRKCGDGPVMTMREWQYTNSIELTNFSIASMSVDEPFTISFCDLQCPNDCEYFVDVTATPGTDFVNVISVNVNEDNDASMSAFANGICCD